MRGFAKNDVVFALPGFLDAFDAGNGQQCAAVYPHKFARELASE